MALILGTFNPELGGGSELEVVLLCCCVGLEGFNFDLLIAALRSLLLPKGGLKLGIHRKCVQVSEER